MGVGLIIIIAVLVAIAMPRTGLRLPVAVASRRVSAGPAAAKAVLRLRRNM